LSFRAKPRNLLFANKVIFLHCGVILSRIAVLRNLLVGVRDNSRLLTAKGGSEWQNLISCRKHPWLLCHSSRNARSLQLLSGFSQSQSSKGWASCAGSCLLEFSFDVSLIIPVSNRHRGSGRPLSPATPPYMRVRIRRFSSVELEYVPQPRETERIEVSNRKCGLQSRAVGQAPGPMGTAGGLCREVMSDVPLA